VSRPLLLSRRWSLPRVVGGVAGAAWVRGVCGVIDRWWVVLCGWYGVNDFRDVVARGRMELSYVGWEG
jgi:hypothetical protein